MKYSEMKPRALKALHKKAMYGPDIDISQYELEEPRVEGDLNTVEGKTVFRAMERVGIDSLRRTRYLQVNEAAYYRLMEKTLSRYGVKIMPLRIALEKLDIAKQLAWNLVNPDSDKYTAAAYLYGGELGYFVYVPSNVKVPIPIYTCLVLASEKRIQFTHNVVYIDDNSEAHIVTGCAVPHGLSRGMHIGISEFFLGRNAKLTFSMIHAWSEGIHVRPRTAVRTKEGSEYVSYYVIYSPVASIQAYPTVFLDKEAKTYMATIIAGEGTGIYDLGSRAILEAPHTSAEIVSRVLAMDRAKVYARAEIKAKSTKTKGHIECLGLLLSETAEIQSIPIIASERPGAELSHEAAIGVIAQEELEYLMSKGFTDEEARAIIIRGFMSIEAPGIPSSVRAEISKILDLVTKYAIG